MKILITGGSSGVGAACVRLLVARGHEVVFTYRTQKENAIALQEETGASFLAFDQQDESSVAALSQEIKKRSFSGLVLNAQAPIKRESFLKSDSSNFSSYVVRQLEAAHCLSQAFAGCLKSKQLGGALVYVLSSVVFAIPPEKQSAYVTSKYALLGLARSQVNEFAKYNIRVNAVSPGMLQTKFNFEIPERYIEVYSSQLPFKRIATVEEVAQSVGFLLSEEASYIHGANIPITGGQVC